MNKTIKIVLVVAAALVVAGGFLVTGFLAGRVFNRGVGFMPARMMRPESGDYYQSMRNEWKQDQPFHAPTRKDNQDDRFDQRGMANRMFDDDRLNRSGRGCDCSGAGIATAEPLSLEAAEAAVQKYVDTLNNDDLAIAEVMIFDNQAYARVVEQSTGMGAMELLVDNASQSVYPEPGANRMWNQKYSPMTRRSMFDNGMRGFGRTTLVNPTVESTEDMTVTAEEAVAIAQDYLDQSKIGEKAGEAEPFYGYYTVDILKDGKVAGMVSVNGFSGQLLPHTWHGTFIEMSKDE